MPSDRRGVGSTRELPLGVASEYAVSGAASSTKRTPPSATPSGGRSESVSERRVAAEVAKGSDQSASSSARTGVGASRAGALVRLTSSRDQRAGAVARTPSKVDLPVRRGRGLKAPSSPKARAERAGSANKPSPRRVASVKKSRRDERRLNRNPPPSTRRRRGAASRSDHLGSEPTPRHRKPARRARPDAPAHRPASGDRFRWRCAWTAKERA